MGSERNTAKNVVVLVFAYIRSRNDIASLVEDDTHARILFVKTALERPICCVLAVIQLCTFDKKQLNAECKLFWKNGPVKARFHSM